MFPPFVRVCENANDKAQAGNDATGECAQDEQGPVPAAPEHFKPAEFLGDDSGHEQQREDGRQAK